MSMDLDSLQRWMQTVITHPDGIAAGIDSHAAQQHLDVASENVERVVARSRALGSIERLAVYGNAYYARLIECLAAEFPATQRAVGEEAFRGFAFGYLQQHPSKSYTLGDLGAALSGFLAQSRPPREGDGPDWADFLVDVATLERVYSEVFDGPGEERLSMLQADALQSIPPAAWDRLRLKTAPSLRLVELRAPVQDYIAAVRKGDEAVIPDARATRLAINRRDYIVRRRTLDPLPFDLLGRLQQGAPLGAAIAEAVTATDADTDDLASRLQSWFRTWTAAGYFVDVELPVTSPKRDGR